MNNNLLSVVLVPLELPPILPSFQASQACHNSYLVMNMALLLPIVLFFPNAY